MRRVLWAALWLGAAGCSEEAVASRGRVVESAAGTVELGIEARGYRESAVTAPAAVSGTITASTVPADSVLPVGRDARVCGDSASVREVVLGGNGLANALVWVEGVTEGRALPETKRSTVTIERCTFEPRVTAVTAGSTVNVFSRDRVSHKVRFYREGAGEPVANVYTVDAGQVVPSESIAAKPGIVEGRCDHHPWVRAYIAVFDHPYFALTDAKGAFTIDELPAGTYTVKVWHEGMAQPASQQVVVSGGGTGRIDLQVALK